MTSKGWTLVKDPHELLPVRIIRRLTMAFCNHDFAVCATMFHQKEVRYNQRMTKVLKCSKCGHLKTETYEFVK